MATPYEMHLEQELIRERAILETTKEHMKRLEDIVKECAGRRCIDVPITYEYQEQPRLYRVVIAGGVGQQVIHESPSPDRSIVTMRVQILRSQGRNAWAEALKTVWGVLPPVEELS